MAFMDRDADGKNQLTLVNGDETQVIPIFGNRLVNMAWSPDGSTLAVSVANVSDYSGLVLKSRLYFVSWPASVDQVLDLADETIEQHVWSPDGKSILVVTRQIDGSGIPIQLFRFGCRPADRNPRARFSTGQRKIPVTPTRLLVAMKNTDESGRMQVQSSDVMKLKLTLLLLTLSLFASACGVNVSATLAPASTATPIPTQPRQSHPFQRMFPPQLPCHTTSTRPSGPRSRASRCWPTTNLPQTHRNIPPGTRCASRISATN